MNLSGAVRKLIADDASAFALIGSRVYPLHLPDNPTYPAVVVKKINVNPATNKTTTSPVDNVSMQIDVLSGEYGDTNTAAETIRSALDGFRGDVVFLGDTIPVDGIRYDGGAEDFVDVQDGNGQMRVYTQTDIYTIRIKRDGLTNSAGTNPGALLYFESDAAAVTGGLAVGREYLLNDVNIYGMPPGVRKVIQ